jgi:hypothetical protein
MHRAAFHFIKALGVPSRVTRTGKHKRSQKSAVLEDASGASDDAEDAEDAEDENAEDGAEDAEDENAEDEEAEENDDGDEEVPVDDNDIDRSMDVDASADDVEAMAETLTVDFEPGDTVGKLLAFVNQVRVSSEDVREYLAHSCRMHNIKPIELRLWVRSRWGSLTHCLSATLEVQKVRSLFYFFNPAPLAEYQHLYYRRLTIFVSPQIVTTTSHLSKTNHGPTISCKGGNGSLLSWYTIA